MTINQQKWWENLDVLSNNLSAPCIVNNAIPDHDINILKEYVVDVLNKMVEQRESEINFRFFIEHNQIAQDHPDHIYNQEKVINAQTCSASLYEHHRFGIVMNNCEQYSDSLSRKLYEYIEPFIKKSGYPLGGFSIHMFIGNYGLTPLGVHMDRIGDNVLHLHLGPGSKTMYNWNEKLGQKLSLAGERNVQVIKDKIPFSTAYTFHSGDGYFMPWNFYHIGQSDDFSIGITLWFNNPSKNDLFGELFKSFAKIPLKDERYDVVINETSRFKLTNEKVGNRIALHTSLKEKTITQVFQILLSEYIYSLKSNNGWKTPPQLLNENPCFNKLGKQLKKIFIINHGYKIFHSQLTNRSENLSVFARGYKFSLPNHRSIKKIISILNSQAEISVMEIVNSVKTLCTGEDCLYILQLFYTCGAIDLKIRK